jgi:hypothetical protein
MGSQYVPQSSIPSQLLRFALRTVLLFCFGMGYGLLVTHLHNEQGLAQFQVEGFIKPSYSWSYLVFWGVAGVGLGSLLPWIDTMWEETASNIGAVPEKERLSAIEDDDLDSDGSKLSADWNPVVRSIGAFVGIAFAIVSSLSSLQSIRYPEADTTTAETSVDINPSSISHACPC